MSYLHCTHKANNRFTINNLLSHQALSNTTQLIFITSRLTHHGMTFHTTHNQNTTQPDFHVFLEQWISQQKQQLNELVSATKLPDHQDVFICGLVDRVLHHYQDYYMVKSRAVKNNVFSMISPPWRTSLEDGFMWIGGWRPTMAFQLLYSKSGLQLEETLSQLTRGVHTGDLGDLSPAQMVQVDKLQRKTIKEERDITEKMAKQQETVADSEMVELSGLVSGLMNNDNTRDGMTQSGLNDRVDSVLARKEEGLAKVLVMADDLRLRTLKGVVKILSPKQAVIFLIAGAELHLRVHEWGTKVDEMKRMPN